MDERRPCQAVLASRASVAFAVKRGEIIGAARGLSCADAGKLRINREEIVLMTVTGTDPEGISSFIERRPVLAAKAGA
jgi:hypothetical protein